MCKCKVENDPEKFLQETGWYKSQCGCFPLGLSSLQYTGEWQVNHRLQEKRIAARIPYSSGIKISRRQSRTIQENPVGTVQVIDPCFIVSSNVIAGQPRHSLKQEIIGLGILPTNKHRRLSGTAGTWIPVCTQDTTKNMDTILSGI